MEGVCAWGWSPRLRILMCCCLAALCWNPGALGMLEVVTADESRSPFPNPSDIVVGSASDVIVTVRCVATPVRTVMWRYTGNDSLVPMGLQPFGASQDDGVLRIYPAALLEQVNQYTCSDEGTAPLPVQFRLASDLFFTSPVPPAINVGTNVTAVCPIPDIPRSTVTAENPLETDDITYCNVMSERGVFRSRSVTVTDPTQQVPTYRIEPVNITARPIGIAGNTRAAFSCSITPDQNLTSIQWYFEPMEFGSGMGPVMMDSRFLSGGAEGVTIVGGLADSGTSILVLDGVGNDNEGYYSCVASFNGGITVNSSRGVLVYDATAGNADTIILDPPNILTVMAGEAVTVPCVASGSQQPIFMFGTNVPSGIQNQYSLDVTSITAAAGGEYTCQVGTTTLTFTIDVLEPLTFSATLQAEYIQTVGEDGMTLRCQAQGNPSPGQPIWQRDGVRVAAETGRVTFSGGNTRLRIRDIQEGDAGIYQCLVAVDNQPATTIVQSIYLNVYFLRDISITIDPSVQQIILELPSTPPTITLNCSLIAHPIPRLEWTRNGQPVVGQQAATGHMETPFSLLTMATSELTNGVEIFTCTANLEMNDPISYAINITAYSLVTITEDPQSTGPLILGDIANFTCRARSIPFPNITWFRLPNNMEMDNGDDITIVSQQEEDFTTSSVLSVRVTGEEDFTGFFCVGDNGFDTDTSTTAQLVQAVSPSFLVEPSNVTAAAGDFVSLNCTATGVPRPSLIWEDGEGDDIVDNDIYNITIMENGPNVLSVLEFIASSEAQFRCEAENRAGETESVLVVIIIGGVPGAPEGPTVSNITAREVLVSWVPVVSILPVTQYNVTWVRVDTGESNSTVVDADMTQLLLTDLRPDRNYRVTVVAINRVGEGPLSDPADFTTLEDAPDAAPTNISTSSTLLNQINVSWIPPPEEFQNGVIVRYLVRYVDIAAPSMVTEQTATTTSASLTMAISAGTIYLVSVAAVTSVGDGPFSSNVSQQTLSVPPPLLGERPSQSPDMPVTSTTIPITLPTIPSLQEYSHFWVIALIVTNRIDTTQNPTELFSNNSTFTTYSSVEPGVPYIVAEIDSANYPATFVLGDDDNSSTSVNDLPEFYRNGPLTPGTSYTVFVWGFAPSVPPGSPVLSKRQSPFIPRQYSSYTSTGFLTPISTIAILLTTGGLSGGAIAGLVIGILFFLILLVVTTIVIFIVWGRMHLEEKLGPPPSRQGSMRLREQSQVILTSLRNRKAESELQDLNPNDVRLPVSTEDFESYVKSMHANTDHLFSEEYEILTIKSPNLPHMNCSMPYNVNKNRYANINCFDDSRVRLSHIPGVEGSDYINANYIDGFQKKNAYIATQGPLPNTTPDFWRMVWENHSCCIIMLTNIVEKSRAKCHQYWPEAGSVSFGDLTVTIIEVQELAYYTIRTFRMNRGNDRREVKQFHYTAWPDFGVPDHPNPVIAFIRRIGNFKRTSDGPDIMHCSAGVGRTGTLITIQSMMQMMNEEGKIDIFNFVLDMRRRRNYMVQTERQYIFIHDAILELIEVGETEIPIHILRRRVKELQAQNPDSELSAMEEEYIHLRELDSIDISQFHSAKMSVNVLKNRFPDILPYDSYRVRLLLHPGVSGSDYMNASYVDGYQQRHQYILTQGPLKHTVDDFWRMVWEHRVSTVMMLCQLEEKGKEQSARYWPMEKLRQHGDLFVELTQVQDFPTYTMRELSITNTKVNESRMIRQYQYIDWPEDHCPINAAAIIDLIGVLQKAQHQLGGGPIVVHDSTSVGRTGTFCVLSSVLEQLKVEGIVDLFFCVHSLRLQQPGLVNTMEQYKFCYQAILEFLDSFDHYANFD